MNHIRIEKRTANCINQDGLYCKKEGSENCYNCAIFMGNSDLQVLYVPEKTH